MMNLKGMMDQTALKQVLQFTQDFDKKFDKIIEHQTELARGLMSCYALLELLCKMEDIEIPEPFTDMKKETQQKV